MEQTRNCIWNHQGAITQKVWRWELPFLYATHRQDLFYITVKNHDNIPKGFQVMERTRDCIWNHQGEITQEVWKPELPFLYPPHCHDLFFIAVKYHDNIPKSIQVTEQKQICIKSIKGEITQKYYSEGSHFCTRHCEVSSNIPTSFQVTEGTGKCLWMDVRTDRRQAYCYIPWTFWSRDKKEPLFFHRVRHYYGHETVYQTSYIIIVLLLFLALYRHTFSWVKHLWGSGWRELKSILTCCWTAKLKFTKVLFFIINIKLRSSLVYISNMYFNQSILIIAVCTFWKYEMKHQILIILYN